MNDEKLKSEAERWYNQAWDDLEAAQALFHARKFAQTCFCAQQAAEKGMKAVWFLLDLDPWGSSSARLIRELPDNIKADYLPLLDLALGLDKFYIPTRYPDALADLIPANAFTAGEAQAAIQSAETILAQIGHRGALERSQA
jgi:HEPN domain-containing protein